MKKPRGRPTHKDKLTPAEWRTADAVRHGLFNQQIADLEKISLDGVKYHVANAIAKLELKNRKALKNWVGSPVDNALNINQTSKQNSILDLKVKYMKEEFNIIGLGQVSRSVKNIVESESWYRDILGLTHLYTFGTMAFFDDLENRPLAIMSSEPKS